MNYLLTLLSQMAAIASVGYVYLGHTYMTTGWGLHPMIAGAVALSLIILPHGFAYYVRGRELYKYEELEAEHEQLTTSADWLRLHPPIKHQAD